MRAAFPRKHPRRGPGDRRQARRLVAASRSTGRRTGAGNTSGASLRSIEEPGRAQARGDGQRRLCAALRGPVAPHSSRDDGRLAGSQNPSRRTGDASADRFRQAPPAAHPRTGRSRDRRRYARPAVGLADRCRGSDPRQPYVVQPWLRRGGLPRRALRPIRGPCPSQRRRDAPPRHDAQPAERLRLRQLLPFSPRCPRSAGARRSGGDRSRHGDDDPRSQALLGERPSAPRGPSPPGRKNRHHRGGAARPIPPGAPHRPDVSWRTRLLRAARPGLSPRPLSPSDSPSRARDEALRRPHGRAPPARESRRGARGDGGARIPDLRPLRSR